jgi:hypothetical protein
LILDVLYGPDLAGPGGAILVDDDVWRDVGYDVNEKNPYRIHSLACWG